MKEKKTKKTWNGLSAVVLVLLLLAQGWLMWCVWGLNMLPNSYLLIAVGALLALDGVLCLLLFRAKPGRYSKKTGHGKQIAGYLLSLLIIVGSLVGTSVVGKVMGTINTITDSEKINVVLEVYVRDEDSAQYLQDAADYRFAVPGDVPEEDLQKILTELQSLLGFAVDTVEYADTASMLEALLDGSVDAAILNSAYLTVFEEVVPQIRMLHELVIEKEVPKETKPQNQEKPKNEEVTDAPFVIYISGNDARRPELADGGSDVNILALVNPQTHQVLLINTPRDYYVVNPASGNGSMDKLSHCGLRGIDNCIGAMTDLYGHEIDYYARINFSGFRTLVDAIGGVTVYSDVAFTAQGKHYFREGENHLNGEQALAFARERKALKGGDNDRGKNQMRLISAMIQQLSVDNLIANYAQILKSLEGMFSTNFPAESIGKLVQLQLTEMPSWDVLTFAVTGSNGTDSCWAKGGVYAYVMYPHEHMVAHASDLMDRFLQGEVLTEADLTVPTE